MICKNCSFEVTGKYCHHCGQKAISKHSYRALFQNALGALNLTSGIFLTLARLLLSPNKLTNDYLFGNTKKYTHPFTLFFISLGLLHFISEFGLIGVGFDETRDFLNIGRSFITSILVSLLLSRIKPLKLSAADVLIVVMWFETIRILVIIIETVVSDILWKNQLLEIYFSIPNFPFFLLIPIPLLYFSFKRRIHFVLIFLGLWILVRGGIEFVLLNTIDPEVKTDELNREYQKLQIAKPVAINVSRDVRFNRLTPLFYLRESVKYWDFNKDGYLDMSFLVRDNTNQQNSLVICPYSNESCTIIELKKLQIDSLTGWNSKFSKSQLLLNSLHSPSLELSWDDNLKFFETKSLELD